VGFLLELILELIVEVVWIILYEMISGFLSALLGSAFPRLREALDRGAAILWSLAVVAGVAAGSVSLSVAPHRLSTGPASAVLAWLLLPLLAGAAAGLTGRRLRRNPSTRQAWFIAGVLFGVAYLAVRLVIPR
jgi:hypothetical protein